MPMAIGASLALLAMIGAIPGVLAETDPNDVQGRLDLRVLRSALETAGGPMDVTVRTAGKWSPRVLGSSTPNRLIVLFDADQDGSADYSARVRRSAGSLGVSLSASGEELAVLEATRPDRRSVSFTVPSGLVSDPNGRYGVAARTRFVADAGACASGCSDRAPDSGWIPVAETDGGGTEGFACTLVLGFSQTRQWYLDEPDFESVVPDEQWQLLWAGGAELRWQDPDFSGWSEPILSACTDRSNDPDRVVLTITSMEYEDDVSVWVTDLEATVETIRAKFPNVAQIVLQPAVGGPADGLCSFGGDTVRASFNHPYIDRAIAQVTGGDVVAGPSPEVRTCDDYEDLPGHLVRDARGPIGRAIGEFFVSTAIGSSTGGGGAAAEGDDDHAKVRCRTPWRSSWGRALRPAGLTV
ncbi:MAG: hypothetical protein ACRDQ2_17020 [Gaiellales bacterium]